MKHDQIWNAVNAMYKVSKSNEPGFPDHVCAQAAMIAQPLGKLIDVAIEKKYGKGFEPEVLNKMLEDSAIDTIVAAVRFLENIK